MNIGIDIDGVLTDIHRFNRRHAPPFFKRKFNREVVDENPYDIRDIFGCPDNEWISYWKKYLFKYATVEPARDGAKAFTRTLRKEGHVVFIISKRVLTSRQDFLGKLMRSIVRNWLWRNGIRYREVVFCDHDIPDSKKTVCLERHVDIMIEDDPENIHSMAPVTKVICYDTSYNRDCEGENIIRAKDWDEAYTIIGETGEKSAIAT